MEFLGGKLIKFDYWPSKTHKSWQYPGVWREKYWMTMWTDIFSSEAYSLFGEHFGKTLTNFLKIYEIFEQS